VLQNRKYTSRERASSRT